MKSQTMYLYMKPVSLTVVSLLLVLTVFTLFSCGWCIVQSLPGDNTIHYYTTIQHYTHYDTIQHYTQFNTMQLYNYAH